MITWLDNKYQALKLGEILQFDQALDAQKEKLGDHLEQRLLGDNPITEDHMIADTKEIAQYLINDARLDLKKVVYQEAEQHQQATGQTFLRSYRFTEKNIHAILQERKEIDDHLGVMELKHPSRRENPQENYQFGTHFGSNAPRYNLREQTDKHTGLKELFDFMKFS